MIPGSPHTQTVRPDPRPHGVERCPCDGGADLSQIPAAVHGIGPDFAGDGINHVGKLIRCSRRRRVISRRRRGPPPSSPLLQAAKSNIGAIANIPSLWRIRPCRS